MTRKTELDVAASRALRAAYEGGEKSLRLIQAEFHIGPASLKRLAKKGKWTRTRPPRLEALAHVDWAAVRRCYEGAEEPVTITAARFGISAVSLHTRASGEGWVRSKRAYRNAGLTSPPSACTPQTQLALVQRLYEILGTQIAKVASREAGADDDAPDKAARQLEQLVKCFKTLQDLRVALGGADQNEARRDERSPDEIRASIKRRLVERLRARRAGRASGESDGR